MTSPRLHDAPPAKSPNVPPAAPVGFPSAGGRCAGWYLRARRGDLADRHGRRPCVVLAHGFAATADCGLSAFAEAFAGAGLDALAFDYRGFGDSPGHLRQVLDPAGQLADYEAAVAHVRARPDVDAGRVLLWGTSFSAGTVLAAAARDHALAGIVAMTPAADGAAALAGLMRREGPRPVAALATAGVRDAWAALRGREPVEAAAVGEPGSAAVITAPGALARYEAIAGPTWRNAVAARIFLRIAVHRPVRRAADLTCPLLVQVAAGDRTAPPRAQRAVARRARRSRAVVVRTYEGDHFDPYAGGALHEHVVADQVAFAVDVARPGART